MVPYSKFEAKGNEASGQAHQNIVSLAFNCRPAISPCEWNRKKKAILCSVLLLVIIPAVVVPVYFEAHPHHEFQSSSTTNETQTTPAVAPTGTQTSPLTSPAPGASTTAPSSVATSATSTATLPPPPRPTADGIHLVNALDGTANYSGFAWYASAIDGNNGSQPNDYANTTANTYAEWENQNRTAFFPRSNILAWALINSTDAPVNKADGEASNGYRSFLCYKDNGRLLFKQNGYGFSTEYYCQ